MGGDTEPIEQSLQHIVRQQNLIISLLRSRRLMLQKNRHVNSSRGRPARRTTSAKLSSTSAHDRSESDLPTYCSSFYTTNQKT
jgi:hypothetical protein